MDKKEKAKRLNIMLNAVPFGRYMEFKKRIVERTVSSLQTIYNWSTGRTEIPDLAMPIIEEVFKEFTK